MNGKKVPAILTKANQGAILRNAEKPQFITAKPGDEVYAYHPELGGEPEHVLSGRNRHFTAGAGSGVFEEGNLVATVPGRPESGGAGKVAAQVAKDAHSMVLRLIKDPVGQGMDPYWSDFYQEVSPLLDKGARAHPEWGAGELFKYAVKAAGYDQLKNELNAPPPMAAKDERSWWEELFSFGGPEEAVAGAQPAARGNKVGEALRDIQGLAEGGHVRRENMNGGKTMYGQREPVKAAFGGLSSNFGERLRARASGGPSTPAGAPSPALRPGLQARTQARPTTTTPRSLPGFGMNTGRPGWAQRMSGQHRPAAAPSPQSMGTGGRYVAPYRPGYNAYENTGNRPPGKTGPPVGFGMMGAARPGVGGYRPGAMNSIMANRPGGLRPSLPMGYRPRIGAPQAPPPSWFTGMSGSFR